VWWDGEVLVASMLLLIVDVGGRKRGRWGGVSKFVVGVVLAFMVVPAGEGRAGVREGGGMTARNVRGVLNVGVAAAAFPPSMSRLVCPVEADIWKCFEVGRGKPVSLFSLSPDPGGASSRRRFGCAEVGTSCLALVCEASLAVFRFQSSISSSHVRRVTCSSCARSCPALPTACSARRRSRSSSPATMFSDSGSLAPSSYCLCVLDCRRRSCCDCDCGCGCDCGVCSRGNAWARVGDRAGGAGLGRG